MQILTRTYMVIIEEYDYITTIDEIDTFIVKIFF